MDNKAIGVFDSGLGGVSVLRTLAQVLPLEKYIYYGDTANAPYGDRDEAQIRRLSVAVAEKLVARGVKALVIACNTATSAAAQTLRDLLPIPVIGMEPALKPAALAQGEGKILVLATAATLKQDKFQVLMAHYGRNAILLPCPGLMEFVERGELDSPALAQYLEERFSPYAKEKVYAAVLGCTHYVFLRKAIARALPQATLFDGNLGTARRLGSVLAEKDALGAGPGGVTFMGSDPSAIDDMTRLFALQG
ncbi:MAG: glutamate racemase [Clostridia bacterium]